MKLYCCEIEPENIPDVVSIVRCKDCANGEQDINFHGDPCIRCYNSANGVSHKLHRLDWYCADGEQKKT